jgi:hypothetical protein
MPNCAAITAVLSPVFLAVIALRRTLPLGQAQAVFHFPFHCGGRFMAKAIGPSTKSSLLNIAATAG